VEHRKQKSRVATVVVVTMFWVVAGCLLTACFSTTRTTGQVDSASFGRLCFTPENSDRNDLNGCWPVSATDAAGLEQGDCISAEVPQDRNARITSIRKLDRDCRIGVVSVSTSSALQNALLLALIPAAAVIFGVVLPRYRRRRANRPVPGPTDVEVGESADVEVIDLSEPGHRSDRD
jgi:hypothetical protein